MGFFVELQPSWKFLVGPARLVPTASENPFARLLLGCGILHQLLQLLDGVDAGQREIQFVATCSAQVGVRVVESRHHEPLIQLNGVGL
jgi:hypothetical protein